jgi:hypothetical protein
MVLHHSRTREKKLLVKKLYITLLLLLLGVSERMRRRCVYVNGEKWRQRNGIDSSLLLDQ